MGRGLVIGTVRLFEIADSLLRDAGVEEARDVPCDSPDRAGKPRIRTRAFTELELAEARRMLQRMGLLPPPVRADKPTAAP